MTDVNPKRTLNVHSYPMNQLTNGIETMKSPIFILKRTYLFVLLVFLTGCSATGPLYDHYEKENLLSSNKSRVIFFRTGEYFTGSGISAYVIYSEGKVLECVNKGYCIADLPPEKHHMVLDQKGRIGSCEFTLSLKEGQTTYIEIIPRSMLVGVLFGLIGEAIEAASEDCAGGFAIRQIDEPKALKLLEPLRLSS